MNKIIEYFRTDWAAMTVQDWAGLIITVAVFFGMLISFALALNPKRKKELEREKYRVLENED